MTEQRIPHFHNDRGLKELRIHAKEFMCIGARPPLDHPHIFIDIGAAQEAICPYCATRFVFDPSLPPGSAFPEDAVWDD